MAARPLNEIVEPGWAKALEPVAGQVAAMASSSAQRGQQGDRSPVSRSIQSPTSFTQPSPRRASRRT